MLEFPGYNQTMTSQAKKVLIIGGVAAGMSTAAKAKREDPSLEVVVYERNPYISYGACGMPYYVEGIIPRLESLIARSPERMEREGVTVKVRHEVTAINHDRKKVSVSNLETGENFEDNYDVLVFATGARPVIPPFPGRELKGVHSLRLLEDAKALREATNWAKDALIVGGGYIGLEMAEAFKVAGLNVHIVEILDRLLFNCDEEFSELALAELKKYDVKVHLRSKVTAFAGAERLCGVETDNGKIDADLALISVGVRPNSELAASIGVELNPQRVIVCNDKMQTNLKDIYAVGDVATSRHLLTGQDVWIPLGDTANKHGRVAGMVIANKEASFRGVVGTVISKVFDLAFARTGLSSQEAKDAGYSFASKMIRSSDHAGYYPDKRPLHIKLIWEQGSRRLLGAQIAGYGDAAKRIDVIATLLHQQAGLQDLADLDLAYAPPFSSALDALLVAANVALAQATATV